MIYFLWDRKYQILKIGGTCRLRQRMDEQGVLDDGRVLLLGVMDGDRQGERDVREYATCFAERIRNSDWLEPTEKLAEFIGQVAFEPTVFDWGRDASNDEVGHAPRMLYFLVSNAKMDWLKRLGEHVGKPWGKLQDEALKVYAASVGFSDKMPDFPDPCRKKPLIKQDQDGNWWILRPAGKYEPGFIVEAKEPPSYVPLNFAPSKSRYR